MSVKLVWLLVSSALALLLSCTYIAGQTSDFPVYETVTLPIGIFEITLLIPAEDTQTADTRENTTVSEYVPPKLLVFDTVVNKTLWESADGVPFLAAASADLHIKQNSGYFIIHNDYHKVCQELKITSWSQDTGQEEEALSQRQDTRKDIGDVAPSPILIKGTLCDAVEVDITFHLQLVSNYSHLLVSMAFGGVRFFLG